MDKNTPASLVERLKQLALHQKREVIKEKSADAIALQCPQCGAGRAKQDGLNKCGYCGYKFTASSLSDGIHITKNDNSK